jgi:amino acid adenylation domain-containing protein
LAIGYINNDALTAASFVKDHFSGKGRLYRSGDRCRRLNDGTIEFFGRVDQQLKIRGYRVEPAEIEEALRSYPGIRLSAVMGWNLTGEGSMTLCGYYEPEEWVSGSIDQTAVRQHLQRLLAAYLVPSYLVEIGRLPLTGNGKIDRNQLAPPVRDGGISSSVRPPSGPAEKHLHEAIRELMGIKSSLSMDVDFFSLGGDSVRAIQLSSRLRRKGFALEVRDVFRYPVLLEMAMQMRPDGAEPAIVSLPDQPSYEVSASQRRLWFVHQLEEGASVYNTLGAQSIKGDLSIPVFTEAMEYLLRRHESLRTVFVPVQGSPRQKILPYQEELHRLQVIDLGHAADREQEIQRIFRQEGSATFDLSCGPLLHILLLRLRRDEYIFVLNLHHIISDGWSKSILSRELFLIYHSKMRQVETPLAPLEIQYRDFAHWQNQEILSAGTADHRNYWLQKFAGDLPVLQLPTDYPRPQVKQYNSKKEIVSLEGGLATGVMETAVRLQVTPFVLLLSAVNVLLGRYSNQDEVITGIPVAGRSHSQLQQQVGLYMNVLPLRIAIDLREPVASLVKRVAALAQEAYRHEIYPFDQLVEELQVKRDTSRSALFDVLVVSEDFNLEEEDPGAALAKEMGIEVREMETGFSGNKFDLTFYFKILPGGIQFTLGYNGSLFTPERIRKMMQHLQLLLGGMLAGDDTPLIRIDWLTSEEKEFWRAFNDTTVAYSHEKTIHALFEEQVRLNPGQEALRKDGQSLTYSELNKLSNRIARHLLKIGLTDGGRAGIRTDRNFWMIAGMLGILKAGGSYVPIDPAYPSERQHYIIENSGIRILLTDRDIASGQPGEEGLTTVLLPEASLQSYDADDPGLEKKSTDLAYTIYTSGSSGKPKGVMIAHHSAVNLVQWVNKTFDVDRNERLLFITSMCFDLSVYDIFGILAAGGTIVIATQEQVQDFSSLRRLLAEERITFWDSVPTTLNYLVTELSHSKEKFELDSLRIAFLSGDWIPVSLPGRARTYFPEVSVVSLGGATEGTVWSNYYPADDIDEDWVSIPYGVPIDNNFFYVLDEDMNLVPPGITGELFIGGAGVSEGYINDPGKTRHSFMDDPFSMLPGARMYRTGDLGRILPDGNMEFLGRKDFQVKIRGYRVELGEIETVLSRYEGVKEALVNAASDKNGVKYLAAYYIADRDLSSDALTRMLGQHLPEYMIPGFFIRLEYFPLNANGKIDRKALPPPDLTSMGVGNEPVAPATLTEKEMAGIWSDVLQKEVRGIRDDFFMLGGHSLAAAQVIARVQERWQVPLKLRELFVQPTIECLAAEIDQMLELKSHPATIPGSLSSSTIII